MPIGRVTDTRGVRHNRRHAPGMIHDELRENVGPWGVLLVKYGSKENPISPAQSTPAERPAMLSRQVVWHWTTVAGLVVAYVALEWISFIHESKGLPLTPWNPGLGLAFACLVLGGPQ
jgi:hypothetical protein